MSTPGLLTHWGQKSKERKKLWFYLMHGGCRGSTEPIWLNELILHFILGKTFLSRKSVNIWNNLLWDMQASLGLYYITLHSASSNPECSGGWLNTYCLLHLQLHWFTEDLYIEASSDQTFHANWMLPCRNSSVSWSIFTWVITDVTFLPWTQTNSLGGGDWCRRWASLYITMVRLPPKSHHCVSSWSHCWPGSFQAQQWAVSLPPAVLCPGRAAFWWAWLTPVASVTQAESRTFLSSHVSPLHRAMRESSILTPTIHSSIMHWFQSRSAISYCKQTTK